MPLTFSFPLVVAAVLLCLGGLRAAKWVLCSQVASRARLPLPTFQNN